MKRVSRFSPWAVFALVSAGLAADFVWAWQVLPPRVAIHWNLAGQPDKWSSKTDHLISMAFVVFISTLLPTVIALAFPRTGSEFINLPNKEYWLAPERREETLRWLNQQIVWLCVGLTAFWGGLLHLTTLANLSATKVLPATVWLLLAMVLMMPLAWIHRIAKPFSNAPDK